MAKKKKVVHWSKLPRTKLIGMVKKLELQCAKLKAQAAENRELRLLNDRQGELAIAAMQASTTLDDALERGAPEVKDQAGVVTGRMPWETE